MCASFWPTFPSWAKYVSDSAGLRDSNPWVPLNTLFHQHSALNWHKTNLIKTSLKKIKSPAYPWTYLAYCILGLVLESVCACRTFCILPFLHNHHYLDLPSNGSKATGRSEVMANGRASVTQKVAIINITYAHLKAFCSCKDKKNRN